MKICKKCNKEKLNDEYYQGDSTCKECRKVMVRENRAKNIEYYREYDRNRFKNDPKVKERNNAYQKTEIGKKTSGEAKKRWLQSNPVKRAAQTILGNAVKNGKIKKPGFCQSCFRTGRIHGHHCDYSKPLDVIWFCASCHTKWHKENGEGKNGN